MNNHSQVLFSICICNYNMGDTLADSIHSIMAQIDDRFEVILVDDGSSDDSVSVAYDLVKRYSNLRFLALDRDGSRRLGETRNISIRMAKGTWCIFHIDTDDIIGPGLVEFVDHIVKLSLLMPRDVLFSGQQIHMAKRDFLLRHGPFSNIYRGEDRDFYLRLVRSSEWIVIRHKRFISRMIRSRQKLLRKNIRDNFDQIVTDLRGDRNWRNYIVGNLINAYSIGLKVLSFRFAALPFALLKARKLGSIGNFNYPSHSEFLHYRNANTKSLADWFVFFGSSVCIDGKTRIFD